MATEFTIRHNKHCDKRSITAGSYIRKKKTVKKNATNAWMGDPLVDPGLRVGEDPDDPDDEYDHYYDEETGPAGSPNHYD